MPINVKKNIFRFEISVNYTFRVNVFKSKKDFSKVKLSLVFTHSSMLV